MIWISVLLPQPLGPRMHEKRRDPKTCETRSSAATPEPALPQIFDIFETSTFIPDPVRQLRQAGTKRWLNPACSVSLAPIRSASADSRSQSDERVNLPSR